MSSRERILVAMSGGVDSSVAAARLHDAGHDVVGVTLHLWDYPERSADAQGRCCAPEDQYDARRTADALGFPHFTFDRRELFARQIVEPFVEAYLAGKTPSPCTACNRSVKLGELFVLAEKLGAARVATGHYARLMRGPEGALRIVSGVDRAKDQSYFLYATLHDWLPRLVFPLGESTKREVRAEAVARRLPGAAKGESQELCFVGSGAHAYADFVAHRAAARLRPGPIVDELGSVVGTHDGVHAFTVGQRRGIGVALGRRAFVTRIDPETATVHLGALPELDALGAQLADVALAPGVALPVRARVRVRYRHEGEYARVEPLAAGGAGLIFDRPVRAVTSGQVAVFYDGEHVLGGGRIVAACRDVTPFPPAACGAQTS